MSIENEPETTYETPDAYERRYSSFWPQVIVMAALIIWSGYQIYIAKAQSSALETEFASAQPLINASQNAQQRLYALAQDVNQTATHDTYAAQIVKEFNIQLTPGRNAAAPSSH